MFSGIDTSSLYLVPDVQKKSLKSYGFEIFILHMKGRISDKNFTDLTFKRMNTKLHHKERFSINK